jgi:hypothetical protein
MYQLDQHMGATMDHMTLDGIRTELQKMVGLSQWLMHTVNFRGDEGYILPRVPSSSSSCASTSATYQTPTRPPLILYLAQPSAFYATGT